MIYAVTLKTFAHWSLWNLRRTGMTLASGLGGFQRQRSGDVLTPIEGAVALIADLASSPRSGKVDGGVSAAAQKIAVIATGVIVSPYDLAPAVDPRCTGAAGRKSLRAGGRIFSATACFKQAKRASRTQTGT